MEAFQKSQTRMWSDFLVLFFEQFKVPLPHYLDVINFNRRRFLMKVKRIVTAYLVAALVAFGGLLVGVKAMPRPDGTSGAPGGAGAKGMTKVEYDEKVISVYYLARANDDVPFQFDKVTNGSSYKQGTDIYIAPVNHDKVISEYCVNDDVQSGGRKSWIKISIGSYEGDAMRITNVEIKERHGANESSKIKVTFDNQPLLIFSKNKALKSGDEIYSKDPLLVLPKEKVLIKQLMLNGINNVPYESPYLWFDDLSGKTVNITGTELSDKASATKHKVKIYFNEQDLQVKVNTSEVKNGGEVNLNDELEISVRDKDMLFVSLKVEGQVVAGVEGTKSCKYTVRGIIGDVNVESKIGIPISLGKGLVASVNNLNVTKVVVNGSKVVLAPADPVKNAFKTLKINDKPVEGIEGEVAYIYTVEKDAKNVNIEADFMDRPIPGGGTSLKEITLKFDSNLLTVYANAQNKSNGDKIYAKDLLTINLNNSDRVLRTLEIDGKDVPDIRAKTSYDYKVNTERDRLEIVATAYFWTKLTYPSKIKGGKLIVRMGSKDGQELKSTDYVLQDDNLFISGEPEQGYKLEYIEIKEKREYNKNPFNRLVMATDNENLEINASFIETNAETAVESELLAGACVVGIPVGSVLVLEGVESAERVEVYSVMGTLAYAQKLRGERRVEVQARSWASGVYLVRILARDGERTLRVVKK